MSVEVRVFFIGLAAAAFMLLELYRPTRIATFACVGLITVYLVRVLKSTALGLAFGM